MSAITTPLLSESTDSFAGIPLAGWLAETCGTPIFFEYSRSAFFIVFAAAVFWLAARPSVRQAGMVIAIGNVVYTVATIALSPLAA